MTRIITALLVSSLIIGCSENTTNKSETPTSSTTSNSTKSNSKSIYNKTSALLPPAELISNKDRAIAFLEALESGNSNVIGQIVNTKTVNFDHALLNGDISEYKKFVLGNAGKSYSVEVFRAAQQGNYVFTHSVHHLEVPKVGIELFKFEKGQIVEMTGITALIMGENDNGLGAISGPTGIENIAKTGLNSKVVKDFVYDFLIGGSDDRLSELVNEDYIEHNRFSNSGIDGLKRRHKMKAENGVELYYDHFNAIYGEGNFVLSICDGKQNGKAVEIFDLFRLSDNKIAEHWEVISE